MNEAAVELLGEHDFATFGQPPQGVNTVRSVSQAEWQWVTDDLPPLRTIPAQEASLHSDGHCVLTTDGAKSGQFVVGSGKRALVGQGFATGARGKGSPSFGSAGSA